MLDKLYWIVCLCATDARFRQVLYPFTLKEECARWCRRRRPGGNENVSKATVGFSLAPNVGRISLLEFHLLDELYRVAVAHLAVFHADVLDDVVYVTGHVPGITADVDVSVVFAYDLPHLFRVLSQQMTDINLVFLVPGECKVDVSKRSVVHVLLDLVLV